MAPLDPPLASLEAMTSAELQARWRRLTGSPPPRISAGLLRLAIAWEIQARAYGGVSRDTRRALDQLAAGRTRTLRPPAGTRLVRAWQGRTHVVTIDPAGIIRWDDRSWRSLSEVARAITGTRWSGPAFFGLKQRVAA